MDIERYIDDIKLLKPLTTGFMYNTNTWSKLSPFHKSFVADFENRDIRRADVIDAFKAYFQSGEGQERAFLMTMIWGFAENGYGTYRTNKYIESTQNLAWIKEGIDAVKNNDLKTAFKTLNKINGLGISYLSKVLYFATRGAGIKDYALVFDIRVANSLVRLTTPKEIHEILIIYPSDKYSDYDKYNKLMHQYAEKYKIEAESLELFLFEQKFE